MTPFHTPMIPRREATENKYEDSETSDTATQITIHSGEDVGLQTITETTNGSTDTLETSAISGDQTRQEPTQGTGGIVSASGVETPAKTTKILTTTEEVPDLITPEINITCEVGKTEDSDLKISSESEGVIPEKKKSDKYVNSQGVTFVTERWNEAEEKHPFSTRVLIKLLQFFCQLINPNNNRNTPSMRLLGLNLLNTIVESQGTAIADIPQLLEFVCNDMCKYLLQALQKVKKEETVILNLILRVCYNLFVALGSYLKFQMSVFISFSLHLLADELMNQTEFILPVEQRELILETVVQLLRHPSFVVDLYINYDCDPQLDNLFGNLVEFFYKNSSARDDKVESRNNSYIRVLSMEAFSAILQSIYNHTKTPPSPVLPDFTPEILAERKHYKNILMTAAEPFNEEPPKFNLCFELLQENKLLPNPPDAKSLALMFRKNNFLSKKNIGEFLGRNKEFNLQVLEEYAKSFDFKGKPYLLCVREFFESFRPLGESGVMERYIEALCNHFMKVNDNILLEGVPVSVDGIFTLTYSVILLNVDLHSPALADKPGTRMLQKQYISNLRGLNAQKDFPLHFLVDIYDTVLNDEIKIHKQHLLKDLTDNTWYHLFSEAKQEGQTNFIQTKDVCAHYDPLVFNSIWRKVIAATKFVFNTSKTPSVLEKTLSSFQLCALVSAHYKITPAFDNLIVSIFSQFNFGRNEKAHMATVALFTLTQKHGDHLRESWRNVLACLIRLHSLKLLTPKLVSFKDTFTFPEENLEPPKEPEATSLSQFIWSSIGSTSWFIGSTTKDASAEAIEKKFRQKTKEIIKQCKLNDLMIASKSLAAPSLIYWIKVLLSWGSSSSGPQSTPETSTPPQVTTGKSSDQSDTNAAMLCLDLVTQITLLNKNRIDVIWPFVSEHFETMCCSTSIPFVQLYRAVTNLMVLVLNLLTEDRVRNSVLKTLMKATLRNFGNSFHDQKLRRKISVGINRVLIGNLQHFKTSSEWDLANKLISWTYSSPTTLADGFEVLYFSVTTTLETSLPKLRNSQENRTFINRENFSGHMDLISQSIDVKDHPQGQQFAVRCLELLQHVVVVVPLFYDLTGENGAEENEALQLYWIPTLQYLVQLCHDPRLDVQSHAIATLQRALLSSELFILSSESWVTIIEKILFPLLLELLKTPMIDSLSKDVIEEIRLRAASILCKTFLQYLFKIITYSDFNKLWVKVLKFIEMYMNADNSELLAEAVTEALKNILMVMHNVGILRPPKKEGSNGDTEKQDELWQLSWESIDKFCPKLKTDFMSVMEREGVMEVANTTVDNNRKCEQ